MPCSQLEPPQFQFEPRRESRQKPRSPRDPGGAGASTFVDVPPPQLWLLEIHCCCCSCCKLLSKRT
eukprot:1843658-Alexandrium_andersonii.AAC.1